MPRQTILLHYTGPTGSFGESVHRLIEAHHTVVATGPAGDPRALDPHTPLNTLLRTVSAPTERLLYLWIESPGMVPPDGLAGAEIARVAWFTGQHHGMAAYEDFAKAFHLVFTTQHAMAEHFAQQGKRNVGWLPPGAHPSAVDLPPADRDLDIACLLPQAPSARTLAIAKELDSRFATCRVAPSDPPADIITNLARCRVAADLREDAHLDTRLFDAMAAGTLVIAPPADGLGELAMAGRHYAEAASLEEMPALAERYLRDTAERDRIATAGEALARERHTLELRVERLMLVTLESLGRFGGSEGESRFRFGGYYSGPRMDLLPHIPSWARRHLDVGCGTGELCRILKERGMETTVGIEYVEEAAAIARSNADHVLQGDLEQLEIPYPDGYFDCITCGDVLEHLRDPWATLTRLAGLLAPGGRVIISIPNIGFFDVIRSLTQGRWQYADQGILDRTHLRFFAGHGVEEMVRGAGLHRATLQPLTSAPPEMLPRDAEGYVHLPKLRIGPLTDAEYTHLCTYQFLAIGEKPEGDLIKAAENAMERQDYQQAFRLAERATAADPARRVRVQAKALARMGMLAKATGLLEEAMARMPGDNLLRLDAALVLVAADRTADALPLVEEVLRLEPDNDRAHGARGLCALAANDPETARAAFQRALELQFDNPAILSHLVAAARACGNPGAAEPYMRKYTEFYPGKLDMGIAHARLLLEMGRDSDARDRLDVILLLNPDNEEALALQSELEGGTA
jgi:2-polyprenyl-3-methyl-5-hydroxy-6-metoxy-1,4-benzoquinol methylase/Flp pilus assembly protein TadD